MESNLQRKAQLAAPQVALSCSDLFDALEYEKNWSIEKRNTTVNVMVDDVTVFQCVSVESALRLVIKALEARSCGSNQAIRSLAQQFRDGELEISS